MYQNRTISRNTSCCQSTIYFLILAELGHHLPSFKTHRRCYKCSFFPIAPQYTVACVQTSSRPLQNFLERDPIWYYWDSFRVGFGGDGWRRAGKGTTKVARLSKEVWKAYWEQVGPYIKHLDFHPVITSHHSTHQPWKLLDRKQNTIETEISKHCGI